MHKFLFYNKFITCLYMFRALCAHHQEVKIVLYNIWYHHTCRWSSRAQIKRGRFVFVSHKHAAWPLFMSGEEYKFLCTLLRGSFSVLFSLFLFDPHVSVGTLLSKSHQRDLLDLTTKRSGSCIFVDGTRLNSVKSFCYRQRNHVA